MDDKTENKEVTRTVMAAFTDPQLAPIAYGLACAVVAMPAPEARSSPESDTTSFHIAHARECLANRDRGNIERDWLAIAAAHLLLALEHRPRE